MEEDEDEEEESCGVAEKTETCSYSGHNKEDTGTHDTCTIRDRDAAIRQRTVSFTTDGSDEIATIMFSDEESEDVPTEKMRTYRT